jgi:hypothetical protein
LWSGGQLPGAAADKTGASRFHPGVLRETRFEVTSVTRDRDRKRPRLPALPTLGSETADSSCSLYARAGLLAALEKKIGALPADVRQFLSHGLRQMTGSVKSGERFAALGFDWLGAKQIANNTLMMRKIANDTISDPNEQHAKVMREGIALTYSPPQIVVADGVYHFHFENPVLKIADSFAEFLSDWLASGCFSSHNFDVLWSRVGKHVPPGLSPANNRWIKAYKAQFPQL